MAHRLLKIPIDNLDHPNEEMRIANFDEFYRLACKYDELRKIINQILCACLREKTTNEEYSPKIRPTTEVQSLLDILFQRRDHRGKLVFTDFKSNLQRVNLQGANLQNAYLRRADFGWANLRQVDFRRANLQEADFSQADLREADFRNADLQGGKNLDRALLNGAKIEGAIFPEIGNHDNDRDER